MNIPTMPKKWADADVISAPMKLSTYPGLIICTIPEMQVITEMMSTSNLIDNLMGYAGS
jgi:hypothetical protein